MAGTNRRKKVGEDGKETAVPREGAEFLSDVIGKNVAAARASSALSQEDLAARMTALGHKWHGTTVGRVEKGERVVTAEELVGLSLALHPITPHFLLSPTSRGEEGAAALIDLGPDSAVPTLPCEEIDRLYRAKVATLPPPPLVVWDGNTPREWPVGDAGGRGVRLGDLLAAIEKEFGTEALIEVLGRNDSEALRSVVVRFEETGENVLTGSLAGMLGGLEVLPRAMEKLARDRRTEKPTP